MHEVCPFWRSYFAHTIVTLASGSPALAGGVPVRAASPLSPQRSLTACVLGRLRVVKLYGAGACGNACKGVRAGQSEVRLTTGARRMRCRCCCCWCLVSFTFSCHGTVSSAENTGDSILSTIAHIATSRSAVRTQFISWVKGSVLLKNCLMYVGLEFLHSHYGQFPHGLVRETHRIFLPAPKVLSGHLELSFGTTVYPDKLSGKMNSEAQSERRDLWQERVDKCKAAYRRTNVFSEDQDSSGLGWWYGRIFDPLFFKFRQVAQDKYPQNKGGKKLKVGVSGSFRAEVLQEWADLDPSCPVELPPEIRSPGAYAASIDDLCEKIRASIPLPRSKPKYRTVAARHPLGAVIHGTYLPPSGETLQLVASIERNDPLWVFIASCMRKLEEDVREEISVLERHHNDKFGPDSRGKWEALWEKIRVTNGLLKIRGITRLFPLTKMHTENVKMVYKRVQKSRRHAGTAREILTLLKRIMTGEIPRNQEQSRHHNDCRKKLQYLAYIPHAFEWYLKRKVSEQLKQKPDNCIYEVWGVGEKKHLPCPGRRSFQERVYPDIVVQAPPRMDQGATAMIGCIDAKVKEVPRQSHADKYEMTSYMEALKAHNRENGIHAPIKGVIFVAVYGAGFDGAKDELEDTDGRTQFIADDEDEIRFTFVHVHKTIEANCVRKAINEKVIKALKFLLPCADPVSEPNPP